MTEMITTLLGVFFTLLVFFYIIGDNPLFRATIYIFVGVSAGFAGAVAFRNVIIPNLIFPLMRITGGIFGGTYETQDLFVIIPLILSALLLLKLSRRLGRAGNVAMAYLVGIGAAAAIGGSVLGTLFPQTSASINLLDFSNLPGDFTEAALEGFSRLLALVGTLATLIYFHFGARANTNTATRRSPWIDTIGKIGQGFIAVTFGVMFAGIYAAAITALIERLSFLLSVADIF